ncbi:RNase E specificity factor CsrD [Vibrio rumoiensis]|uniref:RNase E specificity factor CsrD n=1 Tax=Vibrio rumoiensis 1S-45 TaxID=1188252 RepID=A0A1E5E5R6_9VIBR|nr:RNase E specificity factor CsrD [Vibrio rumoiensis]OEF28479.1 RNase E specificity factor CsrD [Vibrio rumoiensis 1S-45]
MRYTPTLKLSTRLVSFVTMIVVSAMFILFVGGVFTFKKMGGQYVDQNLERITEIIDNELATPQDFDEIRRWLPKLLQSSNVVELQLTSPAGVVYLFKDDALKQQQQDKLLLYKKTYPLQRNVDYFAEFQAVPPYTNNSYSFEAFFSLTLAVLLVVFCLMKGLHWLRLQLYGSELLEERGRMILAGQVEKYAKGDEREWPYTASEALNRLIIELNDARQERSRFDTFIRTHTFLDQLTGAANRVLFDSRLESVLQETGASGGVLLVDINGWDTLTEEVSKNVYESFLVSVGQVLNNLTQKYPNAVFARYYDSQFALMIPHQSEKEISQFCHQCINQLEKLEPPKPLDIDNWCHLGVSIFSQGEGLIRIIDETESALKTAKLERVNNWAKYKKKVDNRIEYRGGVRWRNLFDLRLNDKNLFIYEQPCYLIDSITEKIVHFELFSRIQEESGIVVKASRFLTAIQQVGYERKMDQTTLKMVFDHLKRNQPQRNYSINLFTVPFKKKEYLRWFRNELLQLPKALRQQLSFEFVEGSLINDLDVMRPIIKMLSGLGCTIIVNQVGRTIVSTHYIKDLPITFLKLHRSLVKQIDRRNENQLFIRSLLGSCVDSGTAVIAVGVETKNEWDILAHLGLSGGQGRYFEEEKQLLPNIEITASIKPGRRNRWRK